jgi:alkylation response protein AidB-like acyl-CoA dehydrogenase
MIITSLGFMPVWVAGSEEQRRHFAAGMRNGMTLAWGLSERHRGSDILANDMVAERVEGGYRITGEKWLIGNATVADAVTVFARTDPRGGPAGFSIFVIEKRALPAGAVVPLRDEPLLGLRALDMSGVRLDGVFVPESARIGGEGQGLEITLKSSQMVRASIASLALGCTDTGLRLAMDFAAKREIFGQRVLDIPYSRRQLAECFADVIIAGSTTPCWRSRTRCARSTSSPPIAARSRAPRPRPGASSTTCATSKPSARGSRPSTGASSGARTRSSSSPSGTARSAQRRRACTSSCTRVTCPSRPRAARCCCSAWSGSRRARARSSG